MKRKSNKQTVQQSLTLSQVCAAFEHIAPRKLAQEWDNVGLLAGDQSASVQRVLLSIDLTNAVVDEAIKSKCDLLIVYHPPIFKPIRSLVAPGSSMEALVWQCIRSGIALYSPHTALDAAEGGTNDVLAGICRITKTEPLEYVDDSAERNCKIVVFVPRNEVDAVADAMFAAGAGHIGDYSHCSFRTEGEGSFLGGGSTSPRVGQRGRLETVREVRLEVLAKSSDVPAILAAMRRAHPYEEPAFDVYPLRNRSLRGIGRVGNLPKPVRLKALARKLRAQTNAPCIQLVGDPEKEIRRAIIVAGSAGSLPFRIQLQATDVIVTGEIRHHDALSIARHDCSAIALGHWASERPVLTALRLAIRNGLPGLDVRVSIADRDSFWAI